MIRGFLRATFVAVLLTLAPSVLAQVQDFTLVNESGVDIYLLHISESGNDSWEEDVLGEQVLEDGYSTDVSFTGSDECLWDLLVIDGEGTGLRWDGVDLCEHSQITLLCNEEECWAEGE